jgi:hypothetical protein
MRNSSSLILAITHCHNPLSLVKKQILQYMKEKKESSGLEPGVVPSPIEQQYVLSEYDVVKGPLMVSKLVT